MTGSLSCPPNTAFIELIERHTLAQLAQIKDELMALQALPVRDAHGHVAQRYANRLEQLVAKHRQRKQDRDRKRTHYHQTLTGAALTKALDHLKRESQHDSLEHRQLKQQRKQELAPLAAAITQTDQEIQHLKHQYTTLSRQWQVQLQAAYAATQPSTETSALPILYQDEALIVVDKPAGLLSVPGRRYHQQDSVLSRLRCQLPDDDFLQVVHRLDQATSGILVLAKSSSAHKALGQQFAQHQVDKTYEAILSRPIEPTAGIIDLPLWGNPNERPKQSVNGVYGKPSQTYFQVLPTGEKTAEQTGKLFRIQLVPHTGRTHQLRVHAAHPQGLNSPILGDSLYGQDNQNGQKNQNGHDNQAHQTDRLHLHATSLRLTHPITQQLLQFTSAVPF